MLTTSSKKLVLFRYFESVQGATFNTP